MFIKHLFVYKDHFTQKKNLDFIHIPKNAGSSIEFLAKKYNIKWGMCADNIEVYKESECDYYKWHSPYIVKKPDTQTNYVYD